MDRENWSMMKNFTRTLPLAVVLEENDPPAGPEAIIEESIETFDNSDHRRKFMVGLAAQAACPVHTSCSTNGRSWRVSYMTGTTIALAVDDSTTRDNFARHCHCYCFTFLRQTQTRFLLPPLPDLALDYANEGIETHTHFRRATSQGLARWRPSMTDPQPAPA